MGRSEPLNTEDKHLINLWLKTHSKTVWMWACCLFPIFLFTVIGFFFFPEINWIIVPAYVFIPFELFFAWKLVSALLKKVKIKSALRKGIKEVSTGSLENLEVGRSFLFCTFLLYTINNTTIKVGMPKVFAIARNGYLKQARVSLEVLPLSAGNNIILAIAYPDIPLGSILTEPVSSTEKESYKRPWSKKGVIILACILGLWSIVLALTSKPELTFTLSLIFIVPFIYLVVFNEIFNHDIQNCTQKISVTGIITEVILSGIDKESSDSISTYCYRVDNELFYGGEDYNSFILGDKVYFSYLANKNGEQELLVSAVKIV